MTEEIMGDQKQTIYATNNSIGFHDAEGKLVKTLRVEDLTTNTDFLLFALFYQQTAAVRLLEATAVATAQTVSAFKEVANRAQMEPEQIMNIAMKSALSLMQSVKNQTG